MIDSRGADHGDSIRRRRECLACGKRFTTYERVARTARLMVVKKDGTRVPFDPEKIMRGVQAACGKRAIPEPVKDRLVRDVEDSVFREFEREVPSDEIGHRVAAALREVDHIAYIRYASEYYEFRTLDELGQELKQLQDRPINLPNQRELFSDGG